MKYLDFRSDTVTMPTKNMRNAMAEALVGDDVYEDDPTVQELEALAAEMLGKEAALFVPSGTFGNQLAILTHTRRGDEILVGDEAHIVQHEVGASAVIAGVNIRSITTKFGLMPVDELKSKIRVEDIHFPDTGLICMENAHGWGTVVPLDNMKAVYDIAQESGIPVHLDGARIFNAATSLGVGADEIAQYADSVMFCLSKGLCAPVGSMVVGSKTFIKKARKNRKLMGGALRQVGILAAAGLIALREMVPRLKEDHDNIKYLAWELDQIEGITVTFDRTDINMVFFTLPETIIKEELFIEKLLDAGIKINGTEDNEYRFVTNNDISKADVDILIETMKKILQNK